MTFYIISFVLFNVINFPVYRFLYRKFYDDHEEFREALLYWLKPDVFSLFRGELGVDWAAEMKLGFFFFICGGFLVIEILTTQKIFLMLGIQF